MIFLLLLLGFSFVLHRMCIEKGISPWSYIIGFVTGFVLILFATSAMIIYIYGQNVINDPELAKKIVVFTPFAMLFHFLLFIFFRQKIAHLPDMEDDDDNNPPHDEPKKDLSYFR